jgi:hypothetical protein
MKKKIYVSIIVLLKVLITVTILFSCGTINETFHSTSMSMCGKTNGKWGYWTSIYKDSSVDIHIQGNIITVDNAIKDTFRLEKIVKRNPTVIKKSKTDPYYKVDQAAMFVYKGLNKNDSTVFITICRTYKGIYFIQVDESNIQYSWDQ